MHLKGKDIHFGEGKTERERQRGKDREGERQRGRGQRGKDREGKTDRGERQRRKDREGKTERERQRGKRQRGKDREGKTEGKTCISGVGRRRWSYRRAGNCSDSSEVPRFDAALNPIGAGSTSPGSLPAWILRTFLKSPSDISRSRCISMLRQIDRPATAQCDPQVTIVSSNRTTPEVDQVSAHRAGRGFFAASRLDAKKRTRQPIPAELLRFVVSFPEKKRATNTARHASGTNRIPTLSPN